MSHKSLALTSVTVINGLSVWQNVYLQEHEFSMWELERAATETYLLTVNIKPRISVNMKVRRKVCSKIIGSMARSITSVMSPLFQFLMKALIAYYVLKYWSTYL